MFRLTPKQATIAKVSDEPSDTLLPTQKFEVIPGKDLLCQTFEYSDDSTHLRAKLATPEGDPYDPFGMGTVSLYVPHLEPVPNSILVIQPTVLKRKPVSSTALAAKDKIEYPKGVQIPIDSVGDFESNHLKIFTADGEYYVFFKQGEEHVVLIGTEVDNAPIKKDEQVAVAPPPDRGHKVNCPGYIDPESGQYLEYFWTGETIVSGGNFTWGEATKNGSRVPTSKGIVFNIITSAFAMEDIRRKLGNRSIRVNSWYRDPTANFLCGGASRSRHLSGDAIDFVVSGMSPYEVNRILSPWWGSRGGCASSTVFTHIDCRGSYTKRLEVAGKQRLWGGKPPCRARWAYGF